MRSSCNNRIRTPDGRVPRKNTKTAKTASTSFGVRRDTSSGVRTARPRTEALRLAVSAVSVLIRVGPAVHTHRALGARRE